MPEVSLVDTLFRAFSITFTSPSPRSDPEHYTFHPYTHPWRLLHNLFLGVDKLGGRCRQLSVLVDPSTSVRFMAC